MEYNQDIISRLRLLENDNMAVKQQVSYLTARLKATQQDSQQTRQRPAPITWLSNLVDGLKRILRNGFVWFGLKVDVDHGLVNGLSDDDHTQYLLAAGTRKLTGNWDAGAYDITLSGDSADLILGAGSDMKINYDGTDGNIITSLVTASDLEVTCGANKTIELQNVVYDDIRINPGSFDRPGSSDPAIVAYSPAAGAITTYAYEFAKNNIASFTVQIPHSYKVGEDIKVHIHWTPGTRGNEENGATVGWKIDYSWASINDTFPEMATLDLSDACDGTDHKHQMTPDISITGSGKGISSMLLCNVKRTDTGTDDTWASTTTGQLPLLLEIDFHFPIDTLGSRDWGTK